MNKRWGLPKTNYERIKNLTKEEMAELIRLIANWDRKEVHKANKVGVFYLDYLNKETNM